MLSTTDILTLRVQGCRANLEPLRYFAVWLTDGGKGTLSNNILGAEPHHPFWDYLTDHIIDYAWSYPLPYLTVSYATGQWFVTAMWQAYHRIKPQADQALVRVMMDEDPTAAPWVFFTHTRGGTWDNWDNRLFGWLGNTLLPWVTAHLFALGSIAVIVTAGTIWYVRRRRTTGYTKLEPA